MPLGGGRGSPFAMVYMVDSYVGQVIKALKAKGMWGNTLLVLSSDNGGPIYIDKPDVGNGGGNNYPLRGGKGSNLEGGVRVNSVVSGGYLPKARRGRVEEGLIALEDWYTTFSAIVGVDPTDYRAAKYGLAPIDGINQWPLLSGQTSTPPRTEIWLGASTPTPDHVDAVRLACGSTTPTYPYPGACLYNVFQDPTEHVDLSSTNPAKLAQLTTRLAALQATAFSPYRGTLTDLPCIVAADKYQGFYGPWLPAAAS